MKTLKDYRPRHIDEADASSAALHSLCARIRKQCRDLSSLASARKDIEAAMAMHRQICANGGKDADRASDAMEDLVLHLWRTASSQIESAFKVKGSWKAFKAVADWLEPIVERIYG